MCCSKPASRRLPARHTPTAMIANIFLLWTWRKALNRLQTETAVEIVAGARVHGLGAHEKHKVEAFMRGLNRTRVWLSGHPGCTTAALIR